MARLRCAAVKVRPRAGAAGGASPDLAALRQQLQGAATPKPLLKKVVVLGWRGGVADLAVSWREPMLDSQYGAWVCCIQGVLYLRPHVWGKTCRHPILTITYNTDRICTRHGGGPLAMLCYAWSRHSWHARVSP